MIKSPPGIGQVHFPGRPVKKFYAQMLFQLLKTPANRGFCDTESVCSSTDSTGFDDPNECSHILKAIHFTLLYCC
jgi:hypothetical protein